MMVCAEKSKQVKISSNVANSSRMSIWNITSCGNKINMQPNWISTPHTIHLPPSNLRDSARPLFDFSIQAPGFLATRLELYSLRSEEHTSELQSRFDLVCRLL